jgi:hypothetical protein
MRKTIAKLTAAAVAAGLIIGGGLAAAIATSPAGAAVQAIAQGTGPYYPQGTIVDLCIGAADQVYAEAGRDAGKLGSCAGGYTQLPVVSDPGGYVIPVPGSGTSTDVVTVTNPGEQDNATGSAVTLDMIAVSSQSHPIDSWTLASSPAGSGLSISPSGVITGTLGPANTYAITVTATDSVATVGSVTFDWVVTP